MSNARQLIAVLVCGLVLGALLAAGVRADAVDGCGVSGFRTDRFVAWAESAARWRRGDVKIDPQTSPPIEALYCGTKILPGNVYAIYVKRLSP